MFSKLWQQINILLFYTYTKKNQHLHFHYQWGCVFRLLAWSNKLFICSLRNLFELFIHLFGWDVLALIGFPKLWSVQFFKPGLFQFQLLQTKPSTNLIQYRSFGSFPTTKYTRLSEIISSRGSRRILVFAFDSNNPFEAFVIHLEFFLC